MSFTNPITGGQGALIRPAIKSPNYQPGTEGWTINRDGTAEFSDLTIHSSDGSDSVIDIANGEITITNGAGIVVSRISSEGYKLYHPVTGVLLAESTLTGGEGAWPGFAAYSATATALYAFLGDGGVEFGNSAQNFFENPEIAMISGMLTGDPLTMYITPGVFTNTNVGVDMRLKSALAGSRSSVEIAGRSGTANFSVDGDITTGGNASAGAQDTTARTLTNTAYATGGAPLAVTIPCPESQVVMMAHHMTANNDTASSQVYQSCLITVPAGGGGTTTVQASNDRRSVTLSCNTANEAEGSQFLWRLDFSSVGPVTPGTNITFTLQNRVGGGTGTTFDRHITVWPLTN